MVGVFKFLEKGNFYFGIKLAYSNTLLGPFGLNLLAPKVFGTVISGQISTQFHWVPNS